MIWTMSRAAWVGSVLLALLTPALAQEPTLAITGTVVERGSRRALEGVTVTATQLEGVFAITDELGVFSLPVPDEKRYTLVAAALGLKKSAPVEAGSSGDSPVVLQMEPGITIPEIVVRAERNPENLSKTILAGEELRLVAGARGDPILALTALPGVSFSEGAPAIRGSRPEDNIYIVDFLPVGYLFHMGGLVSTINGDLVEDFHLYKSAFGPELYVADDVTGSAIDVTLRQPRKDRLGGKVNISLVESDLLVEGPVTDSQSFYLGGRRSYYDLFLSKINLDKGVTMRIPVYWDYQGKYLWEINRANSLRLQANGASDTIKFSITEESEVSEKDPDLVGNSVIDYQNHNLGLVWTNRSPSGTVNRLGVGRLDMTTDVKVGRIANYTAYQENYYVKEEAVVRPFARHEITVGGGFLHSNTDVDLEANLPTCTEFDTDCSYKDAEKTTLDDLITINFTSGFLKDRYQLTDSLSLTGGLRATHDDLTDAFIVDPRLSGEWNLTGDVTVTAGWGRYHQMPEYLYISKEFGNPDLDKIQSDHFVLGMEKQFTGGWSAKSEGFYKTFDNLVTSDAEKTFANNGVGRAYGIDFLVKKALTGRFSGWFGFTLSRAERKDNGQGEYFAFDYDQPLDVKLVANYKLTPTWTFGAKWVFHSGTPYTPVVGTDGVYDDGSVRPVEGKLNSARLPNWHSLDLRVEKLYLYGSWQLYAYLEVLNAYWRQNIEGYEYNADYTEKEAEYGLPMIPFFGVRAEF